MSYYEKLIKNATNCKNEDLEIIEDFMRSAIFKSTLDWQTKEVLAQAAKDAQEILAEIGEI